MRERSDVELLAPAGSWEALEAAVHAGADAVYLGGTAFGARQYAQNFDREEIAAAVRFAHLYGVSIYVTVNTLVDDGELEELASYLRHLYACGVDAIIVQDMGVVRLAQQVVPQLELHASTQMTITNSAGAVFAYHQGIPRAVLARECSLEDIRRICAAYPGEIECFIHGALCVCYSGQCLMSSLIGGRSGNRGRCAQPCRLPYELVDRQGNNLLEGKDAGQYLLSPKDLNTLDLLPQLIEAGVASYKIEGRMKRPEYVAVVVDIYRRAIDSYFAGDYRVSAEDRRNIEQIFNRDFTTAYMEGRPGRTMMSDRRPNNRGVLVGRVTRLSRGKALVRLERDLQLGDGLEFWVSVGGRVGTVLDSLVLDGREVEQAPRGSVAEIPVPQGVRLNDRVFRTNDARLMAYAQEFFGEDCGRKIPVSAEVYARLGEPFRLVLQDERGNSGEGRSSFIVEKARKHALDESVIRKQVDRLGTTEFMLRELTCHFDDGVMVPVSEMNEARRQAVEALEKLRREQHAEKKLRHRQQRFATLGRPVAITRDPAVAGSGSKPLLTVLADTRQKAEAALEAGADRVVLARDAFTLPLCTAQDYRDIGRLVRKMGRQWGIASPRIVKEDELDSYGELIGSWREAAPDFLYIGNNGLWEKALATGIPLWADFSLNLYNSRALDFYRDNGAVGAVLSPELTMAQVEALRQNNALGLECIVQGYLEMMVSEYCAPGSFLGELHTGHCSFACREEAFLADRKGAQFPLKHDPRGRMHILNGHELSLIAQLARFRSCGIDSLRIDGRAYGSRELASLVALYRAVLDGEREVTENPPNTTRGHYFRGVL